MYIGSYLYVLFSLGKELKTRNSYRRMKKKSMRKKRDRWECQIEDRIKLWEIEGQMIWIIKWEKVIIGHWASKDHFLVDIDLKNLKSNNHQCSTVPCTPRQTAPAQSMELQISQESSSLFSTSIFNDFQDQPWPTQRANKSSERSSEKEKVPKRPNSMK